MAQLTSQGGSGRRELLPEGDYTAVVVETSDKPAASGNDMFTIKALVESLSGKQHLVWARTMTSLPQCQFQVDALVEAFGVNGKLDTDEIVEGRVFGVTVKHETYDGKTSPKVDTVWKYDERKDAPPPDLQKWLATERDRKFGGGSRQPTQDTSAIDECPF